MRKYIWEYITNIELKIKENHKFTNMEKNILKDKITYFAHERLIHLLITLFFVLYTIIFLCLGMISLIFLIPFALGICFLLFYIPHYFFLENSVQYLYKLYDKIVVSSSN